MNKLLIAATILIAASVFSAQPASEVAQRKDDNIIIASFNVMLFSEDRQNIEQVAKVVEKFDLCGIVELKTVEAMNRLEKSLETLTGKDWKYISSPETGKGSKIERFAFIWRADRVELTGEAKNIPDPDNIYSNEPYIASFKSVNFDFTIMLVHVLWFPPNKKAAEVERLAFDYKLLFDSSPEKDVIMMGDFNYNYDDAKLGVINRLPNIIKIEPQGVLTRVGKNGSMENESIDHIYSFDTTKEWTGNSGAYNFVPVVYPNSADGKKAIEEISDHLPVWAEFSTNKPDDD